METLADAFAEALNTDTRLSFRSWISEMCQQAFNNAVRLASQTHRLSPCGGAEVTDACDRLTVPARVCYGSQSSPQTA
ncbi:hypothetical protein ROHU_018230 [Labeo rohita]|uniref:Uncharacterized protein n=1 Tax=Labeo rohita TaxID=84645 RepID=A0A498NCE5_LABRO|nr:hypothetical protein ROHU_018230 [Labeo rohita]